MFFSSSLCFTFRVTVGFGGGKHEKLGYICFIFCLWKVFCEESILTKRRSYKKQLRIESNRVWVPELIWKTITQTLFF